MGLGKYTQYSEHAKYFGFAAQGRFTLLAHPYQPLIRHLELIIVQHGPASVAECGLVHTLTAAKQTLVQFAKRKYRFPVSKNPSELMSLEAFGIEPVHSWIVARRSWGRIMFGSQWYLTLRWNMPLK